ncbi:condensin-2 complex subunit g2-like [Plakobranchus ocellatus]|uniref:Condensin-2 complex subunit g2-like n=1 Tax=Plakobranchus ocellatus TaxID=259542 RepID=A0AAV4CJT0_9GAST|nr:condensin-2 complex subunit g2-like [Plakobranchus ocellatus]
MAAVNRTELLSTVTKRDVQHLSQVTEKLFSEKALADTVVTLSRRQRSELWDGVLGMCMETLLESNSEETDDPQALAKMHEVLFCITRLASATLSALKQAKKDREANDEDADIEVPASLQETAIILHGILPTLKSEKNGLKNTVCALFETWWALQLSGCEELMANTLLYLLERSTQTDATKVDVGRVMAVHQVLAGVDLSRENAAPLVSLLLQCSYHPQYLTSTQGPQFLAFLLTLSPELAQRLHDTIKNHLPSVPAAWGSKYGEIYFRAWHKSSGEQREILSCLHGKKTQRGVEDMLSRLYEPILWRSLMVCNSEIRLSAAHVMFNAFPLQNLTLHCEEADRALQRQFDAMHNLLQDPVPAVRLAAVQGVGRVLSIYWELIPLDVIKCFMTALVEDLAYDITSPSVREAVIKVMHQLCDNHLALPFLTQVLPNLGNFVHDTSERVRTAVLDLLLKLKGLRAIKFYHVVAVEHLLARLEIETSESVVRRVMRLLFRSFVPVQESPQQQLERCKALIMSNPGAARQFFLYLPKFLEVEDNVKYIVVLCRYLIESARQLNAGNDASSREDDESQSDDRTSGAPDDQGGTSAVTPRRSGRSGSKKARTSKVLTNKNISIRTRRRALECYIEPILMYGCEAWTISKQTQKKLEATEMWFLRRMLRISWTAKKTNDTVLEEAHTTRLLISKIRKHQATFFGHVMRREKLENLVTTGMLEGKRSRGKQREKLIEGLTDWLKAGKSLEAIEATKDRKKWRTMIANAVKQGT